MITDGSVETTLGISERHITEKAVPKIYVYRKLLHIPLSNYPESTKQLEEKLNFQVPAEGLELVVLLHKYTVHTVFLEYFNIKE